MPKPLRSRALELDVAVYRAVRGRATHRGVVAGAVGLSRFGEHALGWLAIGTLGAVVDAPRRRRWLRATASVAAAHGANVVVKRVIRRERPLFEDLPALGRTAGRLSFPSAHAASSFAAAAAFAPLLPAVPWRASALAMGLSRVLLGVHYPSDVVVGAALGTAVGRTTRRAAVEVEQALPPA